LIAGIDHRALEPRTQPVDTVSRVPGRGRVCVYRNVEVIATELQLASVSVAIAIAMARLATGAEVRWFDCQRFLLFVEDGCQASVSF